jgi:hypothetical protein
MWYCVDCYVVSNIQEERVCLHLLSLKIKAVVLPKHWYIYSRLHGIAHQKTVLFIVITVRASNPTFFHLFSEVTYSWTLTR